MSTTIIQGELQIDHERGVIYFHSAITELNLNNRCPTPLRICGLGPVTNPFSDIQIDITIRENQVKVIK